MEVFIITMFIILLALVVGCIKAKQPSKEKTYKINEEQYRILRVYAESDVLLRKKNWYLKELEEDCDYPKLKKLLQNLEDFQKEYAKASLNTKLIHKKPLDSYSAAYIGTLVGGVAVGMVAAHEAEGKQESYKQSVKDAYSSDREKKHLINRIDNCCGNILKIIRKKENLKNDWNKEKATIKAKLGEQYRIVKKYNNEKINK